MGWWSRGRVVIFVIVGGSLLIGCSTTPRVQTPAEAARAKVSFLRREGARLNPYQVSLIHEIPYSGSSQRLNARMRTVLADGEADPGQPDGYRKSRLSTLLRDKADASEKEGTPENSGEDTGN